MNEDVDRELDAARSRLAGAISGDSDAELAARHILAGRGDRLKHLVLHIEVPGFWADDLDRCAAIVSDPDPPGPEDRLYIVTEEWMRETVGVTLVGIPGEKCMSDDFEIRAYTGRIIGAETRDASPGVRRGDGHE